MGNIVLAENIEVDYTSRLDITVSAWKGSSGVCSTQFAPAIETKDGRYAQLVENYQTGVYATGDLMTQTVSGLANGTYRVSIYANAFFTAGRGFDSDIENGAEDVCYVFAGVGDNRIQQYIPAYIATSTTENSLCTLNDVQVTDGTLIVGLGKSQSGTNWHTIQVYEITAIVDKDEYITSVYFPLAEALAEGETYRANFPEGSEAIKAYDNAIAKAKEGYTNKTLFDVSNPSDLSAINAAVETVRTAINNLIAYDYDSVYAAYIETYSVNKSSLIPSIGSWDGNLVSNSGQHWDGTSYSVYYEQTSSQWMQYSWTNYSSTSLTLPAGKYLVMVAGRAASGSDVEAYMQLDDTKVIFPNNGDVGFGVDVNGVGTMSSEATYANGNLGRGWEYRYIAFESDGVTPITLTLGGEATSNHQWMSFTQPILLAQPNEQDKEITYNCIYNGNVLFSEKVTQPVGSAVFIPSSFDNGFVKLTPNVQTISSTTTQVNVTATWNGPFEFSTSFDNAKWYNIAIRNNYYVVMNDVEPYSPTQDANLYSENSQWAFGGNPYSVKIYNRSAGFNKTLTRYYDYAVIRDGEYFWDLLSNGNGFVLREPDTEFNCINQYGGPSGDLKFWNNASSLTDAGSTFHVSEVQPYDSEIIQFADAITKSICVAHWDTDGDGELSKAEAAAVTTIGEVFRQPETSIKTFNELQYFTRLTSLVDYAFYGCDDLEAITLPESITSIGQHAFQQCSPLTSIYIPSGVESIGEGVFWGCSNLNSIIVDSNNKVYDSRSNCNAIIHKSTKTLVAGCKNTVIPEDVTSIGTSAFGGCFFLNSITIPEKVTSIGNLAFEDCHFSSFIIPKGVTSIGYAAFTYCYNLTSVTSYITNPFTIADDTFSGINDSCVLYVPYGTKSLYSARGWNQFANIVEMDAPEGTITVTADNKSKIYGDANPTLTYTTSGGTLSGTPTLTCSAKKASDVGTYPIVISKGSVTNSQVNYVNGTLTVTKAPLTITVNSAVKRVGAANPTFTVTYSGFKNGETEASLTQKPTITCNATTSSAAGNYTIVASGATAKNYEITYVNGTLTVTNESPATVTAESYIRVYGEDNPDFDYFSDATNLGGEPKITCEATKTSPVGTYPIVITKGGVTNANVTYVNGTLTITKAPLKVSVGSYSRNYGEDNPTFTLTYSGFKNGDTDASLTKKPTAICAATPTSSVGSYSIIVSGGESTNYSFSYTNGTLSVKALSTDVFTVNDMTFQLSSTTAKTVKFLRGPNVEECEVPATVTYNNTISCSVTDIADGAFANQESLKSVKIPSSIKTVGKDLFAGSPHMAAITWDTSVKMTKEMAGSVTNNPNLLFYTPDTSKALDGMTNVINTKTNRAARIVLADAAWGNDFFCPIEFTADEITYTHEYKLYTETGKCQGWESIALPFEVKEITHEKNGIIVPFGSLQRGYEFKEDNRPFWLYEYTTRGTFAEAEGIKANVPYIISMPNEYKLWEGYIHKGKVTFKGSNTAVKASSAAKIVKSGNRSFTPNYQNGTSDTAYLLNITDSYDGYPKGSVFVKASLLERKARPFEAYFDLGQNAGIKAYFGIFDQLTDDIRSFKLERPTNNGEMNSMYDLSGRKITKPTKGINIINGQKVLIK